MDSQRLPAYTRGINFMASIQEIAMWVESMLPDHLGELSINHNEHKSNYLTVEEYCQAFPSDWVSDEEKAKAHEASELWSCQWYPNTPVSFCCVHASSLGALLNYLKDQ